MPISLNLHLAAKEIRKGGTVPGTNGWWNKKNFFANCPYCAEVDLMVLPVNHTLKQKQRMQRGGKEISTTMQLKHFFLLKWPNILPLCFIFLHTVEMLSDKIYDFPVALE